MVWNNETTFKHLFNTFDKQCGIGHLYIFDKMISKKNKPFIFCETKKTDNNVVA